MSLSNSPELFINMKSIPDVDSVEYKDFFRAEKEKIKYGVTINGVYIHGWLYWHINHWHINLDIIDPVNQEIIRHFTRPDFRDNEWLIAEYLKKAEDEKKGLMLFGTRRFAKSDFEASYIGRSATIFKGSENVIAGGVDDDIKIIASKVDKGLWAVHPYFRFDRLLDDWRKEVALGIKEKGNKRNEWSKILIRNFDGGSNTEAIAGTTPKSLVIDEVGKFPFLEGLAAAGPGLNSPWGWRCVPVVTGTGGLFEPNSDAEKLFKEPEAHNFLAVEMPGKSKKFGVFIPGTYRMEAKDKTNFGDYIERTSGILIPADSELRDVEFSESNPKKAIELIKDEIAQAELSQDPKLALKTRMYYPIEPEDCFLSDEVNDFPIEAIREHIAYLESLDRNGDYVELYRDADNKVRFTFNTKKKPVTDFPATSATMKDAPVVIYEPPVEEPPSLLYIAGGDPYNQGKSVSSPSLGSVYIYKRLYDPINGTYQNMIVASYTARPENLKMWHETAEMLLELYNATIMIENVGTNFIEYLDGKNKAHLLADGYNLLHEITPTTKIQGKPKGLPPTIKVIEHCMALLYEYCKEKLTSVDEHGKVTTKLGVTRIPDKMLLVEMLNYSSDANVDRIVAFRHVIAYDAHLQKIKPLVKYSDQKFDAPPKEKPKIRSPFTLSSGGPFSTGLKSPFTLPTSK